MPGASPLPNLATKDAPYLTAEKQITEASPEELASCSLPQVNDEKQRKGHILQYLKLNSSKIMSYVHVCTVYCLDTAFYSHISIDRYDNTIILMYTYWDFYKFIFTLIQNL